MNKISKSDFDFRFHGHGHYFVTYFSPKTNKSWSAIITDMTIIDATKNSDEPTIKNLNHLKWLCKE